MLLALDLLATFHENEFVRGHAAGWHALVKLAMRREQSLDLVINAFVRHEFDGEFFTILFGAIALDKNPDPSKRKARPVWGIIDGLFRESAVRESLSRMLDHAPNVKCILLETAGGFGDPTRQRMCRCPSTPNRTVARKSACLAP